MMFPYGRRPFPNLSRSTASANYPCSGSVPRVWWCAFKRRCIVCVLPSEMGRDRYRTPFNSC
uniref:Uncharacterized protein n=1 Tax=Anopheles minimus TaxID=112268 RepID=A0A182W4D5_9DIPT